MEMLKAGLFKEFVIVEVPGIVALTTWALAAIVHYPTVAVFVKDNPGASLFIGLAFITAAGLVLEDLGSLIEVTWDRRAEARSHVHDRDWWAYLCKAHDEKLPALRYLSTVVVRMKFELGTSAALPLSWLGLAVCHWSEGLFSQRTFLLASLAHVLLFAFLMWQSHEGTALLGKIRAEMLRDAEGDPEPAEALPHV